MSPQKRSVLMGKIRGKGTKCELAVADLLRTAGLSFDEHVRELPGRPDFVLRDSKVAIFVDGDFWHGWRFARWRLKLSEHWEKKIAGNMKRDERNFRKLRRAGWKVIRLWEHQVEKDAARCAARIMAAVGTRSESSQSAH
jgi:DNA mismatch endonuclease (patch repair protein)